MPPTRTVSEVESERHRLTNLGFGAALVPTILTPTTPFADFSALLKAPLSGAVATSTESVQLKVTGRPTYLYNPDAIAGVSVDVTNMGKNSADIVITGLGVRQSLQAIYVSGPGKKIVAESNQHDDTGARFIVSPRQTRTFTALFDVWSPIRRLQLWSPTGTAVNFVGASSTSYGVRINDLPMAKAPTHLPNNEFFVEAQSDITNNVTTLSVVIFNMTMHAARAVVHGLGKAGNMILFGSEQPHKPHDACTAKSLDVQHTPNAANITPDCTIPGNGFVLLQTDTPPDMYLTR